MQSVNDGKSLTVVITGSELEERNRGKINFLDYPDEYIHTTLTTSSPETTVAEALEADLLEISQFQYAWSALRGVNTASDIDAGMEALRQAKEGAIRLVINALLFISNSPDKVVEQYPASAPANLVQAADSATDRAAAQAQDRLEQLGYVKIKFCR